MAGKKTWGLASAGLRAVGVEAGEFGLEGLARLFQRRIEPTDVVGGRLKRLPAAQVLEQAAKFLHPTGAQVAAAGPQGMGGKFEGSGVGLFQGLVDGLQVMARILEVFPNQVARG